MNEKLSAFELLEGDHSGVGLRKLQEALLQMKTAIKRAMDAGLDAESFSAAQKVLAAVEAGEECCPRLYDKIVKV